MRTFNDGVAALRKSGANAETVSVKNVNISVLDNWTRVSLTLDREVTGFISDDEGNFVKGGTTVIFVSLYTILAALKANDDTMAIANHVGQHPSALQIILSGAKIELLQQEIGANATYTNPFTEEECEHRSDHDSIFNYVASIQLSDKGRNAVEVVEMKLLGF